MVIAGINDDRRGDANVVTVGERVARLLQECRREREDRREREKREERRERER